MPHTGGCSYILHISKMRLWSSGLDSSAVNSVEMGYAGPCVNRIVSKCLYGFFVTVAVPSSMMILNGVSVEHVLYLPEHLIYKHLHLRT